MCLQIETFFFKEHKNAFGICKDEREGVEKSLNLKASLVQLSELILDHRFNGGSVGVGSFDRYYIVDRAPSNLIGLGYVMLFSFGFKKAVVEIE